MPSGVVVAINVNSEGGVPKHPVKSAFLHNGGVHGDRQNDLKHHGGPDRAVSIYSLELIHALQHEGHPIVPGSTGENLTIEGLEWDVMEEGVRFTIGEAVIELTGPAPPCKTISHSFLDKEFVRISENRYPGWSRWYARVITEGYVKTDDHAELESIHRG